jgi:4-hydroxy-3-polyprenylbenzoate decarboxylase
MAAMTAPQTVFLGVTGASGAPYAVRLTEKLFELGCSLSLCISDTGVDVIRHELRLAAGDREKVTAAFLEMAGAQAIVYHPADLGAPVSSGSAFPDAAVVCPCSLSTAAHIALGTTRTLIHRAGAVALKERRPLVLVPREVPLSSVHLRRLLEASEAGAFIVPPMPAFYNRPTTLQDAIDSVVGKVLSVLGFAHDLYPPWGRDST